jgi:uncharacterized protein (TIGR03067 family)
MRSAAMRTRVLLAVGLVALLGADTAKKEGGKDLDKLQGDWVMESSQRDGKKMPAEELGKIKRTIAGDKMTITRDGDVIAKGTIKVDAAKKPKAIDVTFSNQAGEEQTIRGIYEVDGDRQKVCYAPPGMDRPKEFSAEAGSGHTMSVWKKEKK